MKLQSKEKWSFVPVPLVISFSSVNLLIKSTTEELGLFKQQQTFYQKWRLKTINLPMVADGSPVPSSSWMWPGWPDRSITGIAAHLKGFLNYWGCCGGKASAPVDSRVSSVSTALIHTLTDAGFSLTLAALGKSIHRGGCIWTAAGRISTKRFSDVLVCVLLLLRSCCRGLHCAAGRGTSRVTPVFLVFAHITGPHLHRDLCCTAKTHSMYVQTYEYTFVIMWPKHLMRTFKQCLLSCLLLLF